MIKFILTTGSAPPDSVGGIKFNYTFLRPSRVPELRSSGYAVWKKSTGDAQSKNIEWNIYTTNDAQFYTVWAEVAPLRTTIKHCWTTSDCTDNSVSIRSGTLSISVTDYRLLWFLSGVAESFGMLRSGITAILSKENAVLWSRIDRAERAAGLKWHHITPYPAFTEYEPYIPTRNFGLFFQSALFSDPAYFSYTLVKTSPRPYGLSAEFGIYTNCILSRELQSSIPWAFGANSYTDPEWGKPDPDPEPPKPDPEPPKPDHLPSHTIMNNVQILSLPDNVPLHGTVTLDLDTDSYCWSGSLQLHGKENLPFIRPTANGPRELQITINGYQWRMFIEKYSRQRTYPAEDYTVSIASRHRQFGSPWAPLTDGAITADISAKSMLQQLLGNTGFTLTQPVNAGWIKTPDFTLRAGSYSWQAKPPIDVVSEIVDSMGAVLIPHPTADSWSLHPRYVISPWALRNAPLSAFSHIIPVGLDMQQGGEVVPQQSYNAVLISGVQFGVAVTVRRSGTAANHPAPDIYNDLHQDVQQCLEHGRNELSKSGDKELITISLPIMPTGTAPELVIPGNPVKYEHPERPSENFCGIVKRLSINVQSSFNVTQSVTIEVHTDE